MCNRNCHNLCNPSPDAIGCWVMFFSGFLQREGGATPFERLHRRVTKHIAGPDTIVCLNSWRDNVRDKAQRVVNWRNGHAPRIVVVGYSYGGTSAVNFCRELQSFDLPVHELVLVDPVARIFGRLPSFLSMLDVLPLEVPANVRRLHLFRQRFDRPRGAYVTLEEKFQATQANDTNAGTLLLTDQVYNHVRHVNMDDLDDVRRCVMRVTCGGAV